MARQEERNDLDALEAIDKRVSGIREALNAVAELDGVKDAVALVDQLEEVVADIAADVEMELHERGTRKGR